MKNAKFYTLGASALCMEVIVFYGHYTNLNIRSLGLKSGHVIQIYFQQC